MTRTSQNPADHHGSSSCSFIFHCHICHIPMPFLCHFHLFPFHSHSSRRQLPRLEERVAQSHGACIIDLVPAQQRRLLGTAFPGAVVVLTRSNLSGESRKQIDQFLGVWISFQNWTTEQLSHQLWQFQSSIPPCFGETWTHKAWRSNQEALQLGPAYTPPPLCSSPWRLKGTRYLGTGKLPTASPWI